MILRRRDPLNRYIYDARDICREEEFSYSAAEKELERYKSDPLKKAGIALYMVEAFPNMVRGYLATYDSLELIGYVGDAENILRNFISRKGPHLLVLKRLLNKYISKCLFYDAIEIISTANLDIFKELTNDAGLKKNIAHMYKTMCFVDEYESLTEDYDFFKREDVFNILKKIELASHEEQVLIISSLIESESYDLASTAFWVAHKCGNRLKIFFDIAVNPMVVEHYLSPRLLYFRDEARRNFGNDLNFVDLAIQSSLDRGEIERAEGIALESMYGGEVDDRLLNHAVRISALTGFLDQSLVGVNEWGHRELPKHFHWQRQKSLADWVQDVEKSQIFDALVRKKNLFSLERFVPKNIGRINKIKPRVALLVSGQLRGSKRIIQGNIDLLSKVTGSDVFMDVWDEQVLSPPRLNNLSRFIGHDLHKKLPEEARYVGGFRKYFPNVTRKITTPIINSVDESKLKADYNCRACRVENGADFNEFCEKFFPGLKFRATFNQAKMFYKMHQADNLLDRYEVDNNFVYDVVIRSRPDLEIKLPIVDELIEAAANNKNMIYLSYANSAGVSDQFAIGSRYAMKIYAQIWEKITEMNSFRYLPFYDQWVLHAAEYVLGAHLAAAGLNVRVIRPIMHKLNSPLIINEIDISEEINMDLDNSPDLKFDSFVEYYFSMRNSDKKFN